MATDEETHEGMCVACGTVKENCVKRKVPARGVFPGVGTPRAPSYEESVCQDCIEGDWR